MHAKMLAVTPKKCALCVRYHFKREREKKESSTHHTVWLMEKWSGDFLDSCDFIWKWKDFMKMNEMLWNIWNVWAHGLSIHFWVMVFFFFSVTDAAATSAFICLMLRWSPSSKSVLYTICVISWWNWQSTKPFVYGSELFMRERERKTEIYSNQISFYYVRYSHVMAFYWCKAKFMTESEHIFLPRYLVKCR